MIITWLGHACFKIQSHNITIVIDPYGEAVGFLLPECKADIVLVTHGHFDHSNSEAFPTASSVVKDSGEYEIQGISIRGVQTFHDNVQGRERGLNTMYRIQSEGISLLHMGDFGENEVRLETLKEIGSVDILMIPVGGTYTIDGAQAARVVKQINPKIILPMHYYISGLKVDISGPESFLKEMKSEHTAPKEKFEIHKEDLVGKTQEVVPLSKMS